jgi:Mlc titration factor MtfA (ptsG expression regulator)
MNIKHLHRSRKHAPGSLAVDRAGRHGIKSVPMRILAPYGLFFVIFYALLIPLVGTLVFLFSGRKEVLFLMPLLLALYLVLSLRKPLRRRRAARAGLSREWRDFLLGHSAYFRGLDSEGRSRFEYDVSLFLAETRIVAAGGAAVSWETRLLIAAGVAAMLHGQPEWDAPLADGVTVYPGYAFDRNYQAGKGNIAGQAPPGGPLLVAEKSLLEGFASERDGTNVLLHELAHFFDLEARKGGLSFRTGTGDSVPWPEVIAAEYERHDFASSILSAYAAQNEAEFFAVASEMFFEDPRLLHDAHRSLFKILQEFYRQDPRQILASASRPILPLD